jgi:NTP pyrophosphatase (non-canonical NTP hydrolase)
MLHLKENPTLADISQYVVDMEAERGFTEQSVLQKCLMLGEEVGELFKAIRKAEKMRVDNNSTIGSVEEEIADVLIFLCSIASRYGIDIEHALREKEERNKSRVWK